MSRAPRISGRQLVSALSKANFKVNRVKGSHHRLCHSDGRRTTVPVHQGEIIGPGLLLKILADCEMTIEDLRRLL